VLPVVTLLGGDAVRKVLTLIKYLESLEHNEEIDRVLEYAFSRIRSVCHHFDSEQLVGLHCSEIAMAAVNGNLSGLCSFLWGIVLKVPLFIFNRNPFTKHDPIGPCAK
jgi:hypothetical protein